MEKDLTEKERQLKLLRNQYESIKGHVKKIKDMKQSRCIEVFQMRNIISGPKKAGQEATAVKDFKMGELVVNKEAIKKSSLQYCLNVLKKNELDEDFKSQHKHKEDFHAADPYCWVSKQPHLLLTRPPSCSAHSFTSTTKCFYCCCQTSASGRATWRWAGRTRTLTICSVSWASSSSCLG